MRSQNATFISPTRPEGRLPRRLKIAYAASPRAGVEPGRIARGAYRRRMAPVDREAYE
jgi:hypothetical protein